MAKAEPNYRIDEETLDHLIAMLKGAIKKGATDEEIKEQYREILDSQYRAKTDQSIKEMKQGRIKRFKSSDDMIKALRSD